MEAHWAISGGVVTSFVGGLARLDAYPSSLPNLAPTSGIPDFGAFEITKLETSVPSYEITMEARTCC